MKRYLAALCALALLAGCKAPGAEPPAPSQPPAGPVPLTQEEVERVNKAFAPVEVKDDGGYTTPVNGFFRSFYETPEKLDFVEFLYYYPGDGILETEDQAEFDALMALPGCGWNAEDFGKETLSIMDLPVPTHRILRSSVDETLTRYAGITTADLADTSGFPYLEEYDAFYTFTSDSGPGQFVCAGGEVDGDAARLWTIWDGYGYEGTRQELTLEKVGENWRIRSHQKAWKDPSASLEGRLANLTGEDITFGVGLEQSSMDLLATLIRRAVRNNTVDSFYDFYNNGWREYDWLLPATLLDGGEETNIFLYAGRSENVVKIAPEEGVGVVYVKNAALYRFLKNGNKERVIDQEAYEKYSVPVTNYLNSRVVREYDGGNNGAFPFHAWDLDRFIQVGESGDGRAQLYEVAVAYQAEDPEKALDVLTGDAYMDGLLWVHDWEEPRYLLAVDGEVVFFGDQYPSQAADLDGDGQVEIIVYQPGIRALTLYDCADGVVRVLDVNETLGADGSDFAGNIGNLQRPYADCITAYFGPAGRGRPRSTATVPTAPWTTSAPWRTPF